MHRCKTGYRIGSIAARALAAAALAGAAGSASAGEPVAVLDVTGSSFINIEVATFIGSVMATDNTAGVIGTLSLASGDFTGPPAGIDLVDLDLTLVPAAMASGTVDGGEFLGSAGPVGITLEGVSLSAPLAGAPSPEAGVGGALISYDLQLALRGEAFATYDLIAVDPAEDATIDLASISPEMVDARLDILSLSTDGAQITAEATLLFETVRVPFEPGLVEVSLTNASSMSLMALGDDPGPDGGDNFPTCSRVDIAEPCGVLDLQDIVAFVQGFSANDPIADIDGNTVFDLQDIVGFVTAFSSDVCDPMGEYYCYGYGGGIAAIEFHEGNAAYALGDHTALTAGIAVSGAALMLGFGSFRRKQA